MRGGKGKTIVGIVLAILIGLVVWSVVSTQARWKYSDLGLAEYKKRNYRKATEYYARAIEAHPNEAFLYNNRGLAYYELERYDEAISDYNKAIELKPDFVDAYYNRGMTHIKCVHYHHKYKTIPPNSLPRMWSTTKKPLRIR